MTNKELIDLLLTLPKDLEVRKIFTYYTEDGCASDNDDILEAYTVKMNGKTVIVVD